MRHLLWDYKVQVYNPAAGILSGRAEDLFLRLDPQRVLAGFHAFMLISRFRASVSEKSREFKPRSHGQVSVYVQTGLFFVFNPKHRPSQERLPVGSPACGISSAVCSSPSTRLSRHCGPCGPNDLSVSTPCWPASPPPPPEPGSGPRARVGTSFLSRCLSYW